MHIASIGIDLGKATFHLVALGERNKVLVLTRAAVGIYRKPTEIAHLAWKLVRERTSWELR